MNSFISKILCLIILLCGGIFSLYASDSELEPTYTLPVCYIQTVDNQAIDQKTTYIDAYFYMIDSDGTPICGSLEDPHKLGIRGRGNASWTYYDKKPYKLKFDKKESLMGMPKNKHFALLNIPWGAFARYGNFFSFELGKEIGLEWTPSIYPVEVVLNGDYIGLYYLTETVRIDETRLNISEQSEGNTDLETIGEGWLVEIDNYTDENQISLPGDDPAFQKQNLFTVHTPEPMNDIHRQWITEELCNITQAICDDNIYSRTWEQYIDAESLAKYFIVQEIVHNFDSFVGSTYFYKDKNSSKWCFGPIWDAGDNFEMGKTDWASWSTESSFSTRRRTWIKNIARHPVFWVKVRQAWENFRPMDRLGYYKDFFIGINREIHEALYRDALRWPEIYGPNYSDAKDAPWSYDLARNHIQWIESKLHKEYITHSVSLNYDTDMGTITLNGEKYPEYYVFDGDEISFVIEPAEDYVVSSIKINGEEVLDESNNSQFTISNIKNDISLSIEFDQPTFTISPSVNSDVFRHEGQTLLIESAVETYVMSISGFVIWHGFNGTLHLSPGVYLVKSDGKCSKICIR